MMATDMASTGLSVLTGAFCSPLGGVGDQQAQPAEHTCSASAPAALKELTLAHWCQLFSESCGKFCFVCLPSTAAD